MCCGLREVGHRPAFCYDGVVMGTFHHSMTLISADGQRREGVLAIGAVVLEIYLLAVDLVSQSWCQLWG